MNLFILISILTTISFPLNPKSAFGQKTDFQTTEKITDVSLFKQGENYRVNNMKVIIGEYSYLKSYEFYKNKVFNGLIGSFSDQTLAYFPIKNGLSIVQCKDILENNIITGGCKEIPEGDLTIQLPYFPNGKYADIYDPFGKKVLTIDLTSKATCNENEVCDRPVEDSENCPQDCQKGEPKLDPVLVEKAGQMPSGFQKILTSSNKWIVIAIASALLVFAGLGFWLWRRYRKYKEQSPF